MITRTDIYAMCGVCNAYITDQGELIGACDQFETTDDPCVFAFHLTGHEVYAFRLATGEVCVVDKEDKPKVFGYNWRKNRHGHVEAVIEGRKVFIHQLVLSERPEGTIPDHIHGDKLDNRKSQLRPATSLQNRRNRKKREGATSKYTGVYWSSTQNRWVASIQSKGTDGKRNHRRLGSFLKEEDAARAWNKAALAEYGEFAPLNKVEDND